MRYVLSAIFLIASSGPVVAQTPPADERWEAAYLGGVRAGYVKTTVAPKAADGKIIVGSIEMRLQIKRFNETVALGMDNGTYETEDGAVIGVFMRQLIGKAQQLEITGVVDGNKIHLTRDKNRPLDPAPWTDRVVGVARQQTLLQEHKVQPGDEFAYLSFEPVINLVVTNRVKVKDYETVELFPGSGKQKYLRVEIVPDRIQNVQLPTLTVWLNGDREKVRSQTEVPGLGELTLVKTTRQFALSPTGAPSKTVDAQRVIPLKAKLPRAHEMPSAVYRIRVKGDDNPATSFSTDGRQKPGNLAGDTFDLFVQKGIVAQADKIGPEHLQSSFFITSADAKVRELARKAVGAETDPWKKAVKIERYVFDNMQPRAHELLATADNVAKTLEGDCTEYAMLSAAMCRAEGVPSRTAIGLVYGEVRGQPAFVFHMWTEVWVRGQWLAIDATLGKGGIGAAHLKISDQTWHNESSLTPMLSTINLLGKLSIDVLRTE